MPLFATNMRENDFKFSYYKPPITNNTPSGDLSLFECYSVIRGEGNRNNLSQLTQQLRFISDPDEKKEHDLKKEFKGSNLPFVTFGGTFSPTRRIQYVQVPTGLFTIDIDHYGTTEQVENLKNRMSEDMELSPVLLFVSPCGDGLKVVSLIRQEIHDDGDYKRAYSAVERYIKETYRIDIDKACKNIDRVCYLCYDPNVILLQAGEGFDVDKWFPQEPTMNPQTKKQNAPVAPNLPIYQGQSVSDYDRALMAVEDIERSGIDIFQGEYNEWSRIAGALSNLGESGRSLFHRISRIDGSNYTETRANEEFDKYLKRLNSSNVANRTNLETLFFVARQQGVVLRSSGQRPTPPRQDGQVPPINPGQIPGSVPVPAESLPPKDWTYLLQGTTEKEMFERESKLPEGLKTGYVVGQNDEQQEIIIGGGYLTGIVAPTNHGKTVMLLNLILNVAERYPDKKFLLLTYEENRDRITEYLLNVYLKDIDLKLGQSNRRLIKEYFRTSGHTDRFEQSVVGKFNQRKNDLFSRYIETERIVIQYVDFDSVELCDSLRSLSGQIGGVFIDYFQCINPPVSLRFNSRQEALKQICFDLKDVTTNTGLPVVLACQFNQEVLCPSDVLITKIGEAGDISRIMGELFGLWNLEKDVGRDMKKEQESFYNAILETHKQIQLETNFRAGGMFIKVLKSRELRTGDYAVLKFRGNNGTLYQNAPTPQPTETKLPF